MEQIHNIVDTAQNFLWSYLNIELLILCALYFTWRTGFVQFRLLGEMFRIVVHGDKTGNEKKDTGMKHISSFHAFIVALASRIGTGNMAGVATAICVGGRTGSRLLDVGHGSLRSRHRLRRIYTRTAL